MARERWRNVSRAKGYQVSDLGRVRSVARTLSDGRRCGGGLLKPTPDKDGYLTIDLAGQRAAVHVLVLEAFHGLRPAGMEGLHGRGGLQDNRASELRWGTHRENERDKRKNRKLIGIGEFVSPPFGVVSAVTSELPDG